jgi:hypothetical protein
VFPRPIAPLSFLPQPHNVPSVFIAAVEYKPVETLDHEVNTPTCTGEFLPTVVPSPIAPPPFAPHPHNVPSVFIAKKVFDTEFGKDNYTVMQAIAKNDTEYNKERRIPLKDQNRASIAPGIPHESYALGPAPDTTHKYGTYIATSEVLTAYIINTTVANGILLEKGPFKDSDVIISFKGTNTFKEAIHDFKSTFMRTDLNKLVRTLGFTAKGEDGDSFINGSFTKVLLHAWNVLIKLKYYFPIFLKTAKKHLLNCLMN